MKAERPLNALEAIFASCNVRFALLVVMDINMCGSSDGDNSNFLAELDRKATDALRSNVLGHLAIKRKQQDEWSLFTTEAAAVQTKIREIPLGKDYGKFLHNLVHRETIPAEGPMNVQILRNNSSDQNDNAKYSNVVGLLVNSNHAMVDGRSLARLIYLATKSAESLGKSIPYSPPNLQDWKDLVKENDNAKSESRNSEPPYLLPPHDILSIKELCRNHSSTGSDCFGFELSGDTINRLRALLKIRTQGSATISGFLAGVILQSLAQEYDHSNPKALALSMLVDLRPHITLAKGVDVGEIPQLHGSVTISESTDRLLETGADSKPNNRNHSLWDLSLSLTHQLKRRIERGEAHRNTLALTSGKFDQAGPSATVELSNLGVCQLPEGAKMFTSQRFDGYDGVSCMVHSESSTGCMRWNVSVGEGLDADMIQQVFQRAFHQCHDLVAEQ